MAILTEEIINFIRNQASIAVIATTDEQGIPHVVRREGFTVLDNGVLAYAEELESSRTNSNLLRALWYDRYIAVTFWDDAGLAFQIKGKPIRFDFTSPLYKQYYADVQQKYGNDADITGVWLIEPLEIRNENRAVRKREAETVHPYFRHLDRSSVKLT